MSSILAEKKGSKNAQGGQADLFSEPRRGRPKKVIQRTGAGRTLTPDELQQEQAGFVNKIIQRAKILARVLELTKGTRAAPWVKFLVKLATEPEMGIEWDPNDDRYLQCFTSQRAMAEVAGKTVRQVKRYLADAVEAGLLKRDHKKISAGHYGIRTAPCYVLCLGPLELNVPSSVHAESAGTGGTSELNVPQTCSSRRLPPTRKSEKHKNAHRDVRPTTVQRAERCRRRARKLKREDMNRVEYCKQIFKGVELNPGGKEVWLWELTLDYLDDVFRALKNLDDLLYEGSDIWRGAVLNRMKAIQRGHSKIGKHVAAEASRATGEVMVPAKDAPATPAIFEKPKGGRLMSDEEFAQAKQRQRRMLKERGLI